MKVWVIIPAYNESEVLWKVLQNFSEKDYHLLVVDDGSKDSTAQVAQTAGAQVLRHPLNMGQGAALQTGIDYALKQGADILVTFDADGQHQVEDIHRLIQALEQGPCDIALGSRFLGKATGITWRRKILLQGARWFNRLTGGPPLYDVQNGLRAFWARVATKIRIHQARMAHASEILYNIQKAGLHYQEVPITVNYTEYSRQKGQRGISGALDILVELFLGRNL